MLLGRLWQLWQGRLRGSLPGLWPSPGLVCFLLCTGAFLPGTLRLHTWVQITALAATPPPPAPALSLSRSCSGLLLQLSPILASEPGVRPLGFWFCFTPHLAAMTNPSLHLPLYDNPLRLVYYPI